MQSKVQIRSNTGFFPQRAGTQNKAGTTSIYRIML